MLPDEILMGLTQRWPCRENSLGQIYALLHPKRPNPRTIVVYGPRATGKSSIVKDVLSSSNLDHVFVSCQECVTGRHLMEQTLAAVRSALPPKTRIKSSMLYGGRCDNLGALPVHLQQLLSDQDRFVIAFDRVDEQREAPPTLLPALARLGEFVPNLTIVLIMRHPSVRPLYQSGVPHIHFPIYSRDQSLHILAQNPPLIFLEAPPPELDYDDESHAEDRAWLWPRYCAAVWDSIGQNCARDLLAFREVCDRLWRVFIAPIIKGDFGTRDFSRLIVAQKRLFQDESVLLDSIVAEETTMATISKNHACELPYLAKWILVAAHLASFNPLKWDAALFMKSSDRKSRKKGGAKVGRPSNSRRVPRHLLAPSGFTLDRLLSIVHAILPHSLRSAMDVHLQISTLTNLRLLSRTSGLGSTDPLEPAGKWRIGSAVTWDDIQNISRTLGFTVADYMVES